ncbi:MULTISPECIES: ABC-three component system middle component 1 [unclassified Pseudoalteromonas]|uniref:ABC-three component system middle component 1 n=1 Tax=unclassified Pseudoalteromonas TaxID=194690 RepID=UPI0015D532F9|nr:MULTISPECIES: ABC-three component system middle component 1 [unclassified Pseudoalteromonas]QLJ10256.1 hypothetical protein GZH31_19755 [Pseudoalteromonas sp. JSTW]
MDNLIEQIFIESQLSLVKVKYIEKDHDFSSLVYIGKKLQGDYFVYLHLPERVLAHVTNDIQIKLLSLIKNHANKFEQLTDETVEISSSFDKNATLIIFTTHKASTKNDAIKKAISIEEDPYFFKKQVLLLPVEELPIIQSSYDSNKRNYIAFIQSLISDTERFYEFTKANPSKFSEREIEYLFVAKLYEKIPFLSLIVTPSNQVVLQQKIDNKLTEKQLRECEKLLELDINDLESWLAELVKEDETND